MIWVVTDQADPDTTDFPWFIFPLFGWGIIFAAHAAYAFVIKSPEEIMIERAAREEQRGALV